MGIFTGIPRAIPELISAVLLEEIRVWISEGICGNFPEVTSGRIYRKIERISDGIQQKILIESQVGLPDFRFILAKQLNNSYVFDSFFLRIHEFFRKFLKRFHRKTRNFRRNPVNLPQIVFWEISVEIQEEISDRSLENFPEVTTGRIYGKIEWISEEISVENFERIPGIQW